MGGQNEILRIYKNLITDFDSYEEKTFTITLNISITNATLMNIHFHEKPKDYIKRYFLQHHFPQCYHMQILNYNIVENKGDMFPTLRCKIKFDKEEYEDCIIICFQHFLINPYWEEVKLQPIERKWHE